LVTAESGQPFLNYELAGYIAASATLASLWVAGKLKPLPVQSPATFQQSLAAAAEAQGEAGDAFGMAE
jgi:hypothetical protein